MTVDGDRGLVRRERGGDESATLGAQGCEGPTGVARPARSSSTNAPRPPSSPPRTKAPRPSPTSWRGTRRESVYFNAIDEASGLGLIATLGVRGRGRGECVIALSLPEGRVLFGLDRAPARRTPRAMQVAGARTELGPVRLRARTRLSAHEAAAFPSGASCPFS